MLALNGAPERLLLVFVWVAAIVGIAVRMTWLDAPYPIIAAVYLAVGWSALLELNALLAGLTNLETALIIGGGCLYTVGAVVYALHRPNPWPAVFGYHELFHALVVAAAAMHYVAIVSLVTRTT